MFKNKENCLVNRIGGYFCPNKYKFVKYIIV